MAVGERRAGEQAPWAISGDEEDSPWMVSSDLHLAVVLELFTALRRYLAGVVGPWHVSAEVFVQYGPHRGDHVAPDVFAAPVEDRWRDAYMVAEEGQFPPLVIEVVSGDSWVRDTEEKALLYERLGAQEYVLFDPTGEGERRQEATGALSGYRREATGAWAPWAVDAEGVLRSRVLGGVGFRAEGVLLRVLTPAGASLPFLDELEEARLEAEAERAAAERERGRAEESRQQAEIERAREAIARQQAEAERTTAEQARQQAEAERTAAEQARQQAEAQAALLLAELQRYRRGE